MASAERQSRQRRERQIQNIRSAAVNFRAFCSGPLKHADLVPQGQVLEVQGSTRTQDRRQDGKKCRKKNKHHNENYEGRISHNRSEISRFSGGTGFKISKIRQRRVTCYMDEFRRRPQLLRIADPEEKRAK